MVESGAGGEMRRDMLRDVLPPRRRGEAVENGDTAEI